MGAPLVIRTELEAAELRRLARRERDGRVAARLIALANVLDGMSREAAARAAATSPWLTTVNSIDAVPPAETLAGATMLPTWRSGRGFTATRIVWASTSRLFASALCS